MGILYLIRHGTTAFNEAGRLTGSTNIPLAPAGRTQAEKLGMYFASVSLDMVVTSGLYRAMETAVFILSRAAAGRVPIITHTRAGEAAVGLDPDREIEMFVDARFNERCFGVLEGTVRKECEHLITRWDVSIDGAESLDMVWQRVTCAYFEVLLPHVRAGRSVLLVAHGMVLRLLMAFIEGRDREDALCDKVDNGSLAAYEACVDGVGMTRIVPFAFGA